MKMSNKIIEFLCTGIVSLAFGGLVSGSFVICGAAVAADNSRGEAPSAGWGYGSDRIEVQAFIERLLAGADLQDNVLLTDRMIESCRTWVAKLPERFGIPEGTGGTGEIFRNIHLGVHVRTVRGVLRWVNGQLSLIEGMTKEKREDAVKDLKWALLGL